MAGEPTTISLMNSLSTGAFFSRDDLGAIFDADAVVFIKTFAF
jgi:hypothetical protein